MALQDLTLCGLVGKNQHTDIYQPNYMASHHNHELYIVSV